MTEKEPLSAKGPFLISIPALAAGEKHVINFRQRERNGRKGWYRPILPLDSVQIVNDNTDNRVRFIVNNTYEDIVIPGTIEDYDDSGVVSLTIENDGSSSIGSDEILVTARKDAYGADDEARRSAANNPINEVIENFTGVRL